MSEERNNLARILSDITYVNDIEMDLHHLLVETQEKINILSDQDVINILEIANIVDESNKLKNINDSAVNNKKNVIKNIESDITKCKQKGQKSDFSSQDLLSISGWNAAVEKFIEQNYHEDEQQIQEFKAQDQATQRLMVSKWFSRCPVTLEEELSSLMSELKNKEKIKNDLLLQSQDCYKQLHNDLSQLKTILAGINKATNKKEDDLDWRIILSTSGVPALTPSMFSKQKPFMREILLKRSCNIDTKLKKKKIKWISKLSSEEFTDFYLSSDDFLDLQGYNVLTVDCLNLDFDGKNIFFGSVR